LEQGAQDTLRRQLMPAESVTEFLDRTRPHFDRKTITDKLDALLQEAEYKPAHGRWRLVEQFGSFAIHKSGQLVGYRDTLRSAEQKSGKAEAATFGTARFGDEECVVFAMNWGFLGGSVGEVVGEKTIAAIEMAKKKKLPLVSFYTSGGMRQHENAYALAQMERAEAALIEYLEETDLPHVAVLFGQVWGGTSASTVPQADTVIGVAGSDFGFAGPRVIENYQKTPVEPGRQSVEINYLNRQLDVIVSYEELNGYLGHYLQVARPAHRVSKEDRIPPPAQELIWDLKRKTDPEWTLDTTTEGIAPALRENQPGGGVAFPAMRQGGEYAGEPERLFANYERLIQDAGRPDGDYLIHSVFDEAVPLYNHYVRGGTVVYPPIIGAITRIDNQPFMVIADQPSYKVNDGKYVRKVPATPRPQDFEYASMLMEVAARRKLPVVTFTDTLGAEPTIEAETLGQSRRISNSMRKLISHRRPVISIVTGALGSGGGLGTTLLGRLHALEDAQIYVAEPTSATSILYGTAQPTQEQVIDTLAVMDASAGKLHEEGFLHTVIPIGGDRVETARNIRHAIIKEYGILSGKSERQLRRLARSALRDVKRGKIARR
jgi:acetyl-CoA carboxylase beta subunit